MVSTPPTARSAVAGNVRGARVLVVEARYYDDIADELLAGARAAIEAVGAEARVFTRREAALAALMPIKENAGSGKQVLCPMPGLVKAILVKEGQEVKNGEPLAIVEAMKMENVLRAERDATVSKIAAKEGDSLAVDAVILEFA